MVVGSGGIKFVNDLGVATYLLMHGYEFLDKKGKSIYFECNTDEEARDFDRLLLDYQPPNEFYIFDSCLMFLKKINEITPPRFEDSIHKIISDLGASAYILMTECRKKPEERLNFRVVGKRGKNVYFEHPAGLDNEFKRLTNKYFTSQFQDYDARLQGLKKIGDFMPV